MSDHRIKEAEGQSMTGPERRVRVIEGPTAEDDAILDRALADFASRDAAHRHGLARRRRRGLALALVTCALLLPGWADASREGARKLIGVIEKTAERIDKGAYCNIPMAGAKRIICIMHTSEHQQIAAAIKSEMRPYVDRAGVRGWTLTIRNMEGNEASVTF